MHCSISKVWLTIVQLQLAVIVLRQELLTVIQRYVQLCSSTTVLTTICLMVQH